MAYVGFLPSASFATRKRAGKYWRPIFLRTADLYDVVKFEVYVLQSRQRALDLARGKGWQNRIGWLERSAT